MTTIATFAKERILAELDAPCRVTDEQIDFYNEFGYIKLKQVFTPKLLEYYRVALSARVAKLSADALPMEQRTTYGKAFLQVINLWTKSETVKEFVFGKRLARIAAELMQIDGVRLYHDQALYKEAGGGITPWHADQYYWPLATEKTVTAWMPLQDTPREMGPLVFSEKSHRFQTGRDLEISDESEMTLKEALTAFKVEDGAFDLGDISFHSGWTYHRAGANASTRPREVMTVIYMDAQTRLAKPKNKNQQSDWDNWCPGAQIGEIVATPLNPVLYSGVPVASGAASTVEPDKIKQHERRHETGSRRGSG
ncbi:MAG: phytanoyl-CoA dioxygenase family protein [Acidobacteria bacterium]|nr:phytanoyl-CoA dioxygenase family protein [Acidobacteriota bacterium]MBW4045063.1 phytanoyl-CoA dioxygenase family protein [Acidobacteriota bacterium]